MNFYEFWYTFCNLKILYFAFYSITQFNYSEINLLLTVFLKTHNDAFKTDKVWYRTDLFRHNNPLGRSSYPNFWLCRFSLPSVWSASRSTLLWRNVPNESDAHSKCMRVRACCNMRALNSSPSMAWLTTLLIDVHFTSLPHLV